MQFRQVALRAVLLSTASAVVLSIDTSAPAIAQQPAPLPPVTVDAPKPQARRATTPSRRATSRGPVRRQAVQPLQQQEPVRYVTPSTGVIGAPPAAYAGGQVGSGARVGLLGNQSVFNTPFNVTSFTDKLNRDQQNRAIIDTVINDPSVQAGLPRGGHQDQFVIRGFRTFQQDILFDGLGGLVDFRRPAIDNIERVEILKGPTALLNGVIFGGNVGGTINLIPKRATDDPITRYTLGYVSKAEFGNYIDFGRRFGENKEWGIRVNGSYRNGPGTIDRSQTEWGFGSAALDYRGERLRWTLDAGIQRQEANPFIALSFVNPGFPIPPAPKLTSNWYQPWTFETSHNRFVATRAEFDLTNWLTVYGAYGASDVDTSRAAGAAGITNFFGDFTSRPNTDTIQNSRQVYDVGARAAFDTGPIKHRLVFSASSVQSDNAYFVINAGFPTIMSNIYNPVFVPSPNFAAIDRRTAPSGFVRNQTLAVADVISVLNERVILTLGARHQNIFSQSFDFAPGPTQGQETARYDVGVVTPAVGLVVKPLERLSIYGNYIEGLQEGPVAPLGNQPPLVNEGQVFPPFVIKQKEIGAKYDFGVFGVGLSAFEIERPSEFTNRVTNRFSVDGLQRNRGVEFNVFGEPLPGVRLIGGVASIDARLVETDDGVNGNRAPGVPQVQVSLYGEYDLPFASTRGLTLTGRVLYSGFQYYDRANTQTIPAWTRFDIGTRYTVLRPSGKPVVLRATIENVTGKNYWVSAIDGLLSQGTPRTYLLSAQFDF